MFIFSLWLHLCDDEIILFICCTSLSAFSCHHYSVLIIIFQNSRRKLTSPRSNVLFLCEGDNTQNVWHFVVALMTPIHIASDALINAVVWFVLGFSLKTQVLHVSFT